MVGIYTTERGDGMKAPGKEGDGGSPSPQAEVPKKGENSETVLYVSLMVSFLCDDEEYIRKPVHGIDGGARRKADKVRRDKNNHGGGTI